MCQWHTGSEVMGEEGVQGGNLCRNVIKYIHVLNIFKTFAKLIVSVALNCLDGSKNFPDSRGRNFLPRLQTFNIDPERNYCPEGSTQHA